MAASGLIPQWITAAAAVLAVMVAFTVFRNDLAQRRRIDRESQAQLFDVWIEEGRWSQVDQDGGPPRTLLTAELRISNASGQSVRGVDGSVGYTRSGVSATFLLGVVGPTAPGSPAHRACRLPQEAFDYDTTLPAHLIRGLLNLDYSFTDASGNRWHRTSQGELRFIYNLANQRRYQEGGRIYKLWKWRDGPHGLRRRIGTRRIRRAWKRRSKANEKQTLKGSQAAPAPGPTVERDRAPAAPSGPHEGGGAHE